MMPMATNTRMTSLLFADIWFGVVICFSGNPTLRLKQTSEEVCKISIIKLRKCKNANIAFSLFNFCFA